MPNPLTELIAQHREHSRAVDAWESIRGGLPAQVDPSAGGLTICSVAYRAKKCLEQSDRLMRRLNPGVERPRWLLFDNNDDAGETMRTDDPRFTVVRGGREFTLGYQHAIGVSTLLSQVRTRFVLMLDPDCFIVLPDWVQRIPAYMAEHQLGFFGTPINPRRHNSYRYFPYMVCMFVDLARVPLRDLCFVPDVWRWSTAVTYQMRRALAGVPQLGVLFRWLLTEQWRTNGWRIKRQFGSGDPVKFECAQPVWDVDEAIPAGSVKRLIHTLTPGSVSPVPKQNGYCSARGFRDMGAPDLAALGWEEFVWRDRPLAFHVGSVHAHPGKYERQLESVVARFGQLATAVSA